VSLHGIEGNRPSILVEEGGNLDEIHCDYIAGCDGFYGVTRPSLPEGCLTGYERTYPFAWLGILAEAAPSRDELLYMHYQRGFALYSKRSPGITRLYLQCHPDEDIAALSNDRNWSELQTRLNCRDGWRPTEGNILPKLRGKLRPSGRGCRARRAKLALCCNFLAGTKTKFLHLNTKFVQ
jgi:p-hydroxybenzoate 3-monooxygenase